PRAQQCKILVIGWGENSQQHVKGTAPFYGEGLIRELKEKEDAEHPPFFGLGWNYVRSLRAFLTVFNGESYALTFGQ
ncbi:hypothetical protein, partial [Pseudaeromonas pectinilytica]